MGGPVDDPPQNTADAHAKLINQSRCYGQELFVRLS